MWIDFYPPKMRASPAAGKMNSMQFLLFLTGGGFLMMTVPVEFLGGSVETLPGIVEY
ncbi:hypothetical protein [Chitinophaga arvensicola]|uniref:hypothetical protein n=1 Tax=Chitinophaga arvensicola TaxID=29529 RepID=UPI0015A673F2|nr:hypothetical protein [Chitinophaga arvensicola]